SYFNIRRIGSGADDVEVALPKLTKTPLPCVLAAPDRTHVVTFERRAQLGDVFGGKASERNREVVAQRHVPAAMVGKAVHQLVRPVSSFSGQDFRLFQRRFVNRGKTVGAVTPPRFLQ